MITETYRTRAKCDCGYIWTNPDHGSSIICGCGSTEIVNEVRFGGEEVTDEVDFKQSVADGYNVDVSEVTVVSG